MNWKTITNYDNDLDAQVAKSVLEANGIPAIIKNGNNNYGKLYTDLKLLVPSAYFGRSVLLLKEHALSETKAES